MIYVFFCLIMRGNSRHTAFLGHSFVSGLLFSVKLDLGHVLSGPFRIEAVIN